VQVDIDLIRLAPRRNVDAGERALRPNEAAKSSAIHRARTAKVWNGKSTLAP
jgi:hypothetical protein